MSSELLKSVILAGKHKDHIAIYGDKLEESLTGDHETPNISEFGVGNANRGRSIIIPREVAIKGYGYIEDRRPGANADPYQVALKLFETICSDESQSQPQVRAAELA